MSTAELNYMGGFFDGEGYVGLDTRSFTPKVVIGQTEKGPLNMFKRMFGGKIYTIKGNPKLSKYINFRWELNGTNAMEFIKTILPYVKSKKRQLSKVANAESLFSECNVEIMAKRVELDGKLKVLKRINYVER